MMCSARSSGWPMSALTSSASQLCFALRGRVLAIDRVSMQRASRRKSRSVNARMEQSQRNIDLPR